MKSHFLNVCLTGLFMLACSSVSLAQMALNTDPIIDWPMREDPNLTPLKPEQILTQQLHDLWLKALKQPELEVRLQVVKSIQIACEKGAKGLTDIYAGQLKQLAQSQDTPKPLAMAAVQTLITLNDKSAADILLEKNKTGKTDWVLLTDSTLAKWDTTAANDIWISRATNPALSWIIRQSALDQLAITAPDKAQSPLRQMLGEKSLDPLLKLASAKAIGQIAKRGLVEDAKRLAKGDLTSRLMAVACLQSHDSDDAFEVATSLITNTSEDPAVVSAACEYLLKASPAKLVNHASQLVKHSDASIRRLAGQCLVKQINPSRVPMLTSLLADAHPTTRVDVRTDLIALAKQATLSEPIKQAALNVLKQSSWEGQEQAAIVLGKLDVKTAANDLFAVLKNADREEARVAASAALRWLDLTDMREPLFAYSKTLFNGMKKDLNSKHANELAQLIQWFGAIQYEPATDFFIEFIPKNICPSQAREAAVWAIGKLGSNPTTRKLTNKLLARVKDANEMNPESPDVQIAAMVTLVRLGNARSLQSIFGTSEDALMMLDAQIVEMCKAWSESIESGKTFVAPQPEPSTLSGWYLQPEKMQSAE
jgi:HEAT repeat protein